MKQILCYGDSNTWGNGAFSQGRIAFEKQWPNILQKHLGADYRVIQEGLPGRVAGNLQRYKTFYNGRDVFRAIFLSSAPVDAIVIALGTNDCQRRYNRTAEQIVHDILWYADEISELQNKNENIKPEVLFIAPPNFRSSKDYFNANEATRAAVINFLKKASHNFIFIEDLELTDDGVHFSDRDHQRVAGLVANKFAKL